MNIAQNTRPRLQRLKEVTIGIPAKMTEEEWNATLDKIIYSMDMIVRNDMDDCITNENMQEVQDGIDLFAKHFFHDLWW